MINLKIIGYYNHYNAGDEQYKISFLQILNTYLNSEYSCDFLDCDHIHNKHFDERDIIILGGGDVLNNYFLDKIYKRFINTNNLILAVSVGLPYVETLITSDKLNIISYIFLRTTFDLNIFKKYFFEDRIFYLPDISLILNQPSQIITSKTIKDENNIINNYIEKLENVKKTNKHIVVLSLSRHIYNKNYITNYNNIITKLSQFCKFLINLNYHIVFLPFNTSSINTNENDIIIHNDILININNNDNITFINDNLCTNDILSIFKLADLSIPMRFHACLFSIYTNTPIIPIYTTRKIKNLLNELEWEYKYDLDKNEKDIPLDLDLNHLLYMYKQLQKDKNIQTRLNYINNNILNKNFNDNISNFINCIKYNKPKDKNSINNIDKLISSIYDFINKLIKNKGYNNLTDIKDLHLQQLIVNIISYKLTNGRVNSEYNYGLQEKIFDQNKDYNHVNEWKWIINNELQKESCHYANKNGLFNLKYVDQEDYSGCHRSGWQYVYKNLETFHNDNSPLFLDLYVDRTFHWNLELNCILKLIPYKNPWIGFIHHTFDESFSDYNCNKLLNCKEFLESLKYCKGLFVLSKYLKDLFDIELKKHNLNINVYALIHPTELNVKSFSYKKFVGNKNKLLIHIGGWLRNVYSFYNIELPKTIKFYSGFLIGDKTLKPYGYTNHVIKKISLKGKNMNNYYPSNTFLSELESLLIKSNNYKVNEVNEVNELIVNPNEINLPRSIHNQDIIDNVVRLYYLRQYGIQYQYNQNISTNQQNNLQRLHNLRREIDIPSNCSSNQTSSNCSFDNTINNNWNKHFYNDILNKINNMEFIDFLENNDYDNLLSENIIYINLVDASAVNTIIECIVRATPIIVNKHPAVVELLGETYPLYFTSKNDDYNGINLEINNMLKTDRLIRRAHYYLKRQNLNKFKITTFINNFSKLL